MGGWAMRDEVQLVSDGDGLAVIGGREDVERFLVSEGLVGRKVGSGWIKGVVGAGAAVVKGGWTGMPVCPGGG